MLNEYKESRRQSSMGSADFNSLPTLAQRSTNRNRFLAQVDSLF